MTTLRFTKDELVEALEARRPWAEQLDARAVAVHEKAEQEALRAFRAECRRMVKLSYHELQDESRSSFKYGPEIKFPACPRSVVAELDRQLAIIRQTRQKNMQVSDSGTWARVHWLLTHDETIVEDLCEANRA